MPEDKNIKHLNGQSLTASEYYYGCQANTWDNMLYPDAIKDRYDRVKILYFELYKESTNPHRSWDDEIRFFKVKKAFDDTKQLLDERTLII